MRDVDPGTEIIVEYIDKHTGKVITGGRHIVTKDDHIRGAGVTDLYVSKPMIFEARTAYVIRTTVVGLPEMSFVHGTQVDVRSYITTRTTEVRRLRYGTNMRGVRETENIKEAIRLTNRIEEHIWPLRRFSTVSFIQVGGCTTIIYDPHEKVKPHIQLRRLLPKTSIWRRIKGQSIFLWFIRIIPSRRLKAAPVIEDSETIETESADKTSKTKPAAKTSKPKSKAAAKKAEPKKTAAKAKPAAKKTAKPNSGSSKNNAKKASSKKSKSKK